MKRVRLTIQPRGSELPLTFDQTTDVEEPFVRVEVVNWNIVAPTAAFLLRVRGDLDRFESLLEDDPAVDDHELLPVTDEECYCFVAGAGTGDARALWETFKRGSLMTIPPATWNPDGSYTFTIVGRDADIQAAVEAVPDDVVVAVESVGGRRVADDRLVDRLADRQRDAVAAAIDLGYYDLPREATTADVADELGCAPSTAAEHLRKAESTVLRGLFDGRQ